MCGLAGILGRDDPTQVAIAAMTAALTHRGPDDGGTWVDPAAGVALGHRRLAIRDLSPAGHQPMTSADGRYVVVYNGEIFNAEDLRADLPGIAWRGHSDTEVLVEACAAWGIAATVRRLIGMFAFALWDRAERVLWLGRDRLGIKPLYWGENGGAILFASELKALAAHPGWTPRVNRAAAAAFLRFAYVPAPMSIYAGITKLPPGHLARIEVGRPASLTAYWSPEDVVQAGLSNPLDLSDIEAADQLEELLCDAVRRRLVADVPVGAFLSGGVDSSAVVALMAKASPHRVRSFTIGFEEADYSEAAHAEAVARHLGTDHTTLTVRPSDAMDVIPSLPEWYDEPFGDSSMIPTYLVSQLTREHVTVALSGDGGDEAFAGYNRYLLASGLWRRLGWMPRRLRSLARNAVEALPPAAWSRLLAPLPVPPQAGDKAHKFAGVLDAGTIDDLYRRLISQWQDVSALMPGQDGWGHRPWTANLAEVVSDPIRRMQLIDQMTYLPDDILTKVDRASMAVALEVRVPILDHRVVEFSWRLPRRQCLRGGAGKWLLRQVLYRHVPKELIERPKMGFGVPIAEWLRGPLRAWAEDLLSPEALGASNLVDARPVRAAWATHLSGRRNLQYGLWNVLMLQAWHRRWGVAA